MVVARGKVERYGELLFWISRFSYTRWISSRSLPFSIMPIVKSFCVLTTIKEKIKPWRLLPFVFVAKANAGIKMQRTTETYILNTKWCGLFPRILKKLPVNYWLFVASFRRQKEPLGEWLYEMTLQTFHLQ